MAQANHKPSQEGPGERRLSPAFSGRVLLLMIYCSICMQGLFQATTAAEPRHSVTGLLRTTKDCLTPEGCGASFKLYDSTLNRYTIVKGPLGEIDDGLIVVLHGHWGPPQEGHSTFLAGSYKTLSKVSIPYFLIEKADAFINDAAPCLEGWNKSYSWKARETPRPLKLVLTVHLTPPGSAMKSSKKALERLQLSYDGITGQLLASKKTPRRAPLCEH